MATIINELKKSNVSDATRTKQKMNALKNKWGKYGLLEGLKTERQKEGLAILLENQMKTILKESNSVTGGSVEGFVSVAFPLIRRVFGNLVADKIVSVQPITLPTGVIFFLDFVYSNDRLGNETGDSIYGGDKVGSGIASGVDLDNDKSFYNLNNGFSSPTETVQVQDNNGTVADDTVVDDTFSSGGTVQTSAQIIANSDEKDVRYDVDILNDNGAYYYRWYSVQLNATTWNKIFFDDTIAITPQGWDVVFATISGNPSDAEPIRRLTVVDKTSRQLHFLFRATTAAGLPTVNGTSGNDFDIELIIIDTYVAGSNLGTMTGENLNLEGFLTRVGYQTMAEIEFKVNSLPITATEKKLKAKWTPELSQDIAAYHNVDAEVELTAIMSEHIELEVDRQIIHDLIVGATAGVFYWSAKPGNFVNRYTGAPTTGTADYTGNVPHWNQTLLYTVNSLSAIIHRKTLKGGANFIVTSPEVSNILEFTNEFRASIVPDSASGNYGIYKSGSISKKMDIYVDPYFPRNLMLLGRKGSSFLESGYVYAPYQQLVLTPTIYHPDDLTPRKGIMMRAGFKMLRSDMYGVLIVMDMYFN